MLKQPLSAAAVRWAQRIERFQEAGLSVAAFCQAEGVSQASFYHWRRKLQIDSASRSSGSVTPPVMFVPVSLAGTDRGDAQAPDDAATRVVTTMAINLPGGISIRFELPADQVNPS